MSCCIRLPHSVSKTTFGVPKNEIEKSKWEEALSMILKKSHRVCASHFNETDIISSWNSGLNNYSISYKRQQLKKCGIPSLNRLDISSLASNSVQEDHEFIREIAVKNETISPTNSLNMQPNSYEFTGLLNALIWSLAYGTCSNTIEDLNIDDSFTSYAESTTIEHFHPSAPKKRKIKIAKNWFANLEYKIKDCLLGIVFHSLNAFKINGPRYIEKQLVLTKGNKNDDTIAEEMM